MKGLNVGLLGDFIYCNLLATELCIRSSFCGTYNTQYPANIKFPIFCLFVTRESVSLRFAE